MVKTYLLELAGPYELNDLPLKRKRRITKVKIYKLINEI